MTGPSRPSPTHEELVQHAGWIGAFNQGDANAWEDNATADVPALPAGSSFTVVFYLPYWVYNPDVTLEATPDYKNVVKECNEDNNLRVFKDIG